MPKTKTKQQRDQYADVAILESENCPLCGRELGTENVDEHHLIPQMFKGKEKFPIHKICHRKIHATFSERELAAVYNTWESLRGHDDIAKFIRWVSKKDPAYYDVSKSTNRKKRYG